MLYGINGLLLDMLDPPLDNGDYANTDSALSSPLAAWTFLSKIVPGFAAAFTVGLANFGGESAVKTLHVQRQISAKHYTTRS